VSRVFPLPPPACCMQVPLPLYLCTSLSPLLVLLQTRSELLQLELLAEEFAKSKALTEVPDSLLTMMDSLYIGFNRDTLAQSQQLQQTNQSVLGKVRDALQVRLAESVGRMPWVQGCCSAALPMPRRLTS